MATVDVASSPTGLVTSFDSPAARAGYIGPDPIGEITFSVAALAIALKGAGDETRVTLTASLPSGFVYRIAHQDISVISSTIHFANGINGFQPLAQVITTENQVTKHGWPLEVVQNYWPLDASDPPIESVKVDVDATTNDFGVWLRPARFANPGSVILDASQGVSIYRVRWMDSSANTTAACVLTWNIAFHQFTVDQFRASAIRTPQLVI